MNDNLLRLKEDFGKYGSWALWDDFGRITPFLNKDNFEELIKPNVIFIGLNASIEVLGDWMGYHQECRSESWQAPTFHIRKFAEVLKEEELEVFRGAYMTDIIKNHFDPNSNIVIEKIKNCENILYENLNLFIEELELLSKFSKKNSFKIICFGAKVFEIMNKIPRFHHPDYQIGQIWHYAAFQLGEEGVKDRIREDLRRINSRKIFPNQDYKRVEKKKQASDKYYVEYGEKQRFDFWEGLRDFVGQKNIQINLPKSHERGYLNIKTSNCYSIPIVINSRESYLECGIYIPSNQEFFHFLEKHKLEIEREVLDCSSDEWILWGADKSDTVTRIRIRKSIPDLFSATERVDYFEWLYKKILILQEVFNNYFIKFKSEK